MKVKIITKMSRNCLLFLIIITLVSSCSTDNPIVYNKSVPLEMTARLSTRGVGTIIGYNGEEVKWGSYYHLDFVQIPAGNTWLEWKLKDEITYTSFIGRKVLFNYNFQEQKQYIFSVGEKNGEYGLNVYEYDFGEKIIFNIFSKHYAGFVPFTIEEKIILK